MEITPLTDYFSNLWPLDPQAAEALNQVATSKTVRRKEFILQAGDKCRHLSFVVSGCLRMYKTDDHGSRRNLQFASENNWIADYSSFHQDVFSEMYIEALEPSQVLLIRNHNLYHLYERFPIFDRNFRIITENAFIELQQRVLHTISSTAEERYLYFLKKYPQLLNRISNVQIASYIGVTPEFLSTIRKKMTRQ